MAEGVLVGDVGGTNVRFACVRPADGSYAISEFQKLRGDDFDGFDAALQTFLERSGLDVAGRRAVFALAGPVRDGVVKLTNRDWTVNAAALEGRFGLSSVRLVNDFKAMGRAVPELGPDAFVPVKPGTADGSAPIIVAGPGTGFGVATLLPSSGSGGWRVLSGEGGFMAYAPQTDLEFELARLLRDEQGYVHTEAVCAGIGLESVHRALCRIFERDFEAMPPGEMLTRAAGGDEMFLELCRIRARGTLRAIGDLVLANGALGGVAIAGGVSQRLIDYLREPDAIDAFTRRGRNSAYMEPVPIRLLSDGRAPLIGCAALGQGD